MMYMKYNVDVLSLGPDRSLHHDQMSLSFDILRNYLVCFIKHDFNRQIQQASCFRAKENVRVCGYSKRWQPSGLRSHPSGLRSHLCTQSNHTSDRKHKIITTVQVSINVVLKLNTLRGHCGFQGSALGGGVLLNRIARSSNIIHNV